MKEADDNFTVWTRDELLKSNPGFVLGLEAAAGQISKNKIETQPPEKNSILARVMGLAAGMLGIS